VPAQTFISRTLRQAGWEIRNTLSNGEQLLLILIIPLAALVGLTYLPFGFADGDISQVVSGVLSVSLLATGFTSMAIATGFDRRSSALAYLGTTPLGRPALITGKLIAAIFVSIAAIAIVLAAAMIIGWRPTLSSLWLIPVTIMILTVYVPWALVLASLIRAEATLAMANAIFVLAMLFGGVLIPASSLPYGSHIGWLPFAAATEVLSGALSLTVIPSLAIITLAIWAIVGILTAIRTFRWR
jgi:ABC-2 type transport system permease protein